jgi:hypothetical protein
MLAFFPSGILLVGLEHRRASECVQPDDLHNPPSSGQLMCPLGLVRDDEGTNLPQKRLQVEKVEGSGGVQSDHLVSRQVEAVTFR